MRILSVVTCALLFGLAVASAEAGQAPVGESAACERLAASLKLPNTAITSAQPVAAGQFAPPAAPAGRGGGPGAAQAFADLPAFCRVAATIKPSTDSDIKAEIWMPLSGWNGKFEQVGNGGWAGTIQYGPLAAALRRGYAAASTDTGHVGGSASFALGHPDKLVDFGYRAVHETAVQGKATIAAFYGNAPRISYFNGCSNGGRQGFQEAQRYPQDFDGIIAGAPAYTWTDMSIKLVSVAQATLNDPASMIPPSKYPVLHQAVLDACDALDGLKDGLVGDPTRCRFDPKVTECKGADGSSCLTSAQVEAAKRIYGALKDPKTGKEISPGLEPGSELLWAGQAAGPRPFGVSDDLFKYVVFQDPNWDFRTLDLAKHVELARKIDGGTLSATSPNLKEFVGRGGKFLIYHGWADQIVTPRTSVDYYKDVVSTLGKSQAQVIPVWNDAATWNLDSVRLFMVPGMAHCGGGEGPNTFDMLTALEQWREKGAAPAQIIASHMTEGKVDRTRPLCPYPQVAQYKGSGSTDQAENFACKAPEGTASR
jgi:feruloyl esterase